MTTQNTNEWLKVANILPPQGIMVETKIDDRHGERNQQNMYWERNLWWSRNGIYVYYTPTHWRHLES